jgi:hypothetical protein
VLHKPHSLLLRQLYYCRALLPNIHIASLNLEDHPIIHMIRAKFVKHQRHLNSIKADFTSIGLSSKIV